MLHFSAVDTGFKEKVEIQYCKKPENNTKTYYKLSANYMNLVTKIKFSLTTDTTFSWKADITFLTQRISPANRFKGLTYVIL